MEFFESDTWFIIRVLFLQLVLVGLMHQVFFSDGAERLWRQSQRWKAFFPRALHWKWGERAAIRFIRLSVGFSVAILFLASLGVIWRRWLSDQHW